LKKLRVGILGGTFDPIHKGHLHIAREVRRLFRLNEVWFLVARTPPHKRRNKISPEWHRCSMVALAIQDQGRFRLCDFELRTGSGYTIDTLRALKRQSPSRIRIYFIAGGDALRDFPSWHKYEDILREFHVIFVQRREGRRASLPVKIHPSVLPYVRAYNVKDAPWEKGSFLIDVHAPDVSSTEIRLCGARKMKKWIPAKVYQYIEKQRLYERR
jgi:nicotinate-nucleotide adenylyltransferase